MGMSYSNTIFDGDSKYMVPRKSNGWMLFVEVMNVLLKGVMTNGVLWNAVRPTNDFDECRH